ncbi:MAG: OadG family protein [Chloroflexi bacterium]|nr:OadG family protein [Chloroflexota bacterium]
MATPMENALLITAAGMGLVFVAILLLWGLMEGLVRWLAPRTPPEEAAAPAEPAPEELTRQAQAAAAAVAVALARQAQAAPPPSPHPAGAWQTLRRAGQMNPRLQLYQRKSRGTRL